MARVKWQVASHRRRKRLMAKAKGYYSARGRNLRKAKETLMRAMAYSTRDRKSRAPIFRSLWIIRLNAAARARGLTYSQLMAACKQAKIAVDRKQLSELALHDEGAFETVLSTAFGRELPVLRQPSVSPPAASEAPKERAVQAGRS